jgi:hypothetical protein
MAIFKSDYLNTISWNFNIFSLIFVAINIILKDLKFNDDILMLSNNVANCSVSYGNIIGTLSYNYCTSVEANYVIICNSKSPSCTELFCNQVLTSKNIHQMSQD